MSLDDHLRRKIEAQATAGRLRALVNDRHRLADFTSNDYLGLSRSAELRRRIEQILSNLPVRENGSTGSRLLSGNNIFIEDAERYLAEVLHCEQTLIFGSGYTANLAVLSSIPNRHDTILYDEYAHASIKDGARLSLAKRLSFRHNDMDDLELKLRRCEGKVFIVVESVYSMDGDHCPLSMICQLAETYQAIIILDEAHSTGVIGNGGAGTAVAEGLEGKVGIRIHTFGKAMGIHGACVAGSNAVCQYLINFSRPFIYTTAPDIHAVASIVSSFAFLSEHLYLQKELQQRINLFTRSMRELNGFTGNDHAIQVVLCKGNDAVRQLAHQLQQDGFDVRPIVSPTVPMGQERIRICLHTFNADTEILKLADKLKQHSAIKN